MSLRPQVLHNLRDLILNAYPAPCNVVLGSADITTLKELKLGIESKVFRLIEVSLQEGESFSTGSHGEEHLRVELRIYAPFLKERVVNGDQIGQPAAPGSVIGNQEKESSEAVLMQEIEELKTALLANSELGGLPCLFSTVSTVSVGFSMISGILCHAVVLGLDLTIFNFSEVI